MSSNWETNVSKASGSRGSVACTESWGKRQAGHGMGEIFMGMDKSNLRAVRLLEVV